MDSTAGSRFDVSAVRIGASAGVIALHAALVLALTLPIVAPINRAEFVVPYIRVIQTATWRDYVYRGDDITVGPIETIEPTHEASSEKLQAIGPMGKALTMPSEMGTSTFDARPREVQLQIIVSAAGAPLKVDVVGSSGDRELDQRAAVFASRNWRFKPARHGGRAIQAVHG